MSSGTDGHCSRCGSSRHYTDQCAIRIYVAASSKEIDRAKAMMQLLRDAGMEITHDWTEDIRKAREAGYAADSDLPFAARKEHVIRDLAAVDRAHALVYLVPEFPSDGAASERQRAYDRKGRIIASDPLHKRRLFDVLVTTVVETDAEVLTVLLAWQQNGII